jgi:hypothetical protein
MRLYCLRQALGTAAEGMRKQLGKERLPARAPWRDNEFWHTEHIVFIVVRWRAARRSSLSFPQDTHPAVRADATGAESALGVD